MSERSAEQAAPAARDDLFDLPTDVVDADWLGVESEKDARQRAPRPALPHAAFPHAPSGAATAPASALLAVTETIAPVGGADVEVDAGAPSEDEGLGEVLDRGAHRPGAPKLRLSGATSLDRPLRVALGVLAGLNAVVFAVVLLRGRQAGEQAPPDEHGATVEAPASATAGPDEAPQAAGATSAAHPEARPAWPDTLPPASALAAAHASLEAARAEVDAGRTQAARTRLGRLLLTIDDLEPRDREEIRAQAEVLVALSRQSDAETARRSRR